jgi:hypothetical protein
MSRLLDVMAIALFVLATVAVVWGILALSDGNDLHALYWTALGAVFLKAGSELLRPHRNG